MDLPPLSTQDIPVVQDRLDQTTFHLNPAQMKAFWQALDMPAIETESNPGLERLLAIRPPWADQGN